MWPVIILLGACMFGLIYGIHVMMPNDQVVVNCSIAEISPDFTTEMREACRKARMQK
jgi:hypothetical protein